MKILLIEDEADLAGTVCHYLQEEGNVCETASNFEEAEEKISLYEYDCLLLDITLPDGSGLDILRSYKKNNHSGGVVIISAKDSLDDKIAGLNLGADDYLPKPFHLHELNARLKSLYRRLNFDGSSYIIHRDIKIDPEPKEVFIAGKSVSLTKKEYEILLFFLQNPRRVVSKNSIAEHLWGDHMDMADSYDFIYSQIKNLRRKLNSLSEYDYLHAVYGVGYKFEKD